MQNVGLNQLFMTFFETTIYLRQLTLTLHIHLFSNLFCTKNGVV